MQENKKNQFVEMEEEILDFWDKSEIFKKSVERDASKGDYTFYDGPPFATGTPHYGHLVGSIMKDVVPRYQTMRGYRVERRWGWDCHGLPIENIVEKELNTKSKKQIEEEVGIAKFNETCRSKVLSYTDDWKKVITRLGRWADMDNAYRTMDKDYMESIWAVFKNIWDKDLVYKDYRSMHVCPRCETTLSQSEVSEGYKDIKDLSVTAKFELVDEPGTFILAWTTTPWTLPGNVALAVGEDIDYIKAKFFRTKEGELLYEPNSTCKREDCKEEVVILAKERLKDVEKMEGGSISKEENQMLLESNQNYFKYANEVIEELKGSELIGKKYKPVFDNYANDEKLENRENGWQIYSADFVTTEDGTGVVHIAPAFGEDDMALGKKYNMPFVQHLAMDGYFKKEMGELAGLNVKPKDNHMTTDIEIIKNLAGKGLLFSKKKYEHSYPHCWRCDTPLLNYATSSWFVNVKKLKSSFTPVTADKGENNLLEAAENINWTPEHIKTGRFGKWLEGARDWSISRQRFWASCIPIWECSCGERKVFGSVSELEELSGQKIDDLHKHIVDEIKIPCSKCGEKMTRIPDVFDCWFESGSMPYAQLHYPFENKEKFDNNFPAEFIAEGADQTRAWFYYLHVISGGVKQSHAFKNVIVNGIVLAEDGKKMSKKLKNYPDPMEVFDKYGADALRYYLLTSSVMTAENLNFSEKGVGETMRKLNNILWNVYKFYDMYATEHSEGEWAGSENILDKWIIARLNQLIAEVTKGMEEYNLPRATRPILDFIDELSTWYLRRSRDRFKGEDEVDKKSALDTLGFVFIELSKVMAPFTPFIAEQLWQKITGNNFGNENKSVHLEVFPEVGDIDENIIKEMGEVRKIVELALAKRDEVGIKIKQPLSQLQITNYKLQNNYINLVEDELNVKEVVSKAGEGDITVELDTEMTPELLAEGAKREVVRFVNAMRKNNDLSIEDRVDIFFKTESEVLKKAISDYSEDIMKDTLAENISEGESKIKKGVKINNEEITLSIIKK